MFCPPGLRAGHVTETEAGWRSGAESRPHRSTNLGVTTCKNPAIAVAEAS